MKEYICKDDLLKEGYDLIVDGLEYGSCRKSIELDDIPTVTKADICKDMVSEKVVEQFMWERDLAIKQLNDLGVGFGEKKSKVDICRKFGKEVIKRYREDSTKGFANIMSEILAEMEGEG